MDAERALKVLLRAITPSLLGAHRVRGSFTADELDAAIDWLNSDAQDAKAVVLDLDAAVVQKAVVAARKRGKK